MVYGDLKSKSGIFKTIFQINSNWFDININQPLRLTVLTPMPPANFKNRKQQETHVGKKRCKSQKIVSFERKQCSKIAVNDTKKLMALVVAFKEASCSGTIGSFSMWHTQLKLSKEMVLVAGSMLQFLDNVSELDELAWDVKETVIPSIDIMIDNCQDLFLVTKTPEENWKPMAEREEQTVKLLDKMIDSVQKVLGMVFQSKKALKAEDRYIILNACCHLFNAVDDTLKSVTSDTIYLEINEELEGILEEAVSKCDDQTLDEYYAQECEDEEEEED
jgi:nicotinic acid mononucleotide adenylyltransferase